MALRTEIVDLLAEKISDGLVEREMIELPDDFSIKEALFEVLNTEVTLEERLNDEVRTLLNEYGNRMRDSGASYQEMFKLIKKKLVRERKIIL
jgi:hypothetical protein